MGFRAHQFETELFRTCEESGKRQMKEAQARGVAKRLRRPDQSAVSAYRCISCGFWHVGNTFGRRDDRPVERQTIDQASIEFRENIIVSRCIEMGWLPRVVKGGLSFQPPREMAIIALMEHIGCPAGRALHGETDQSELWTTVKALRNLWTKYWRIMDAPYPYPRTSFRHIISDVLPHEPIIGPVVDILYDRATEDDEEAMEVERRMAHVTVALNSRGAGAAVRNALMLTEGSVHDRRRYLAGLRAVFREGW